MIKCIHKFGFSILMGCCFWASSEAQTISLQLNQKKHDDEYRKLIMLLPLWKLNGDSVGANIDIGSAKPGDKRSYQKLVVPNSPWKSKHVAYGYLFDPQSTAKLNQGYTLVVIENYRYSAYPCTIYVDRNYDYDLTNDGQPITLKLGDSAQLSLGKSTSVNPFQVELEYFHAKPYSESFVQMNDKQYLALDSNFVGTYYSFRTRRLNTIGANLVSAPGDTFQIAIKDVNCNGVYNEPSIDMVMISNLNDELTVRNGIVFLNKKETWFEWNNCAYKMVEISPDGSKVIIFKDSTRRLKYTLNKNEKLPRFKYCTAEKPQKRRNIRKDKAQLTYIYIWRDVEAEFIKDSATLHQLSRLQNDSFKMVWLNFGTAGRYVAAYNKIYRVKIKQGFSSNKINRMLKIQQVPTGILIDKKQRVVAVNIAPSEVFKYLR